MSLFDVANQALRDDLEAYAHALRTIVATLPRTRGLCDRVIKETRLARALLAFADNQQLADLNQITFQLTNLWPYREQAFARTVGFEAEIEETRWQREEALRGVRALARLSGDPLAAEVSACFTNIAQLLEEERALLGQCHALIQPHAANIEISRKRLDLLVAMVDARLAASPQQEQMLRTYNEAAVLLRDWEGGVPLDERGVQILEQCLGMLAQIDHLLGAPDAPAEVEIIVEVGASPL